MIKGSIYLVTDFDMANASALNGSKVLFVGELNRQIPDYFIAASVLLPPYESVSAEIDGNIDAANYIYEQYLDTSEPCFGMFATILVALYNGVNIVLYIDGGHDLSYINVLLKYFDVRYGLRIGTQFQPFSYVEAFNPQTAVILYSYLDGFIDEYKLMMNIPDLSIIKIMSNHPYLRFIDKLKARFDLYQMGIDELIIWLHHYREASLSYGNVEPGSMITLEEGE